MSYETAVLRDIAESVRKDLPESDFAGKGRSFPIEKAEDVEAAVHALGRAGPDNYDAATLKANIIRIAKRKGFEARLPQEWLSDAEGMPEMHMAMAEKGPRFAVLLADMTSPLKRIPIAVAGRFVKGAMKFAITRQTLADLVANFRKRKADTVIDYEHASEFPQEAQGGPIPAAGWIQAMDDAPDDSGVLWGTAKFTPRAAQMIANEEYRYLSPVIDYGARDKHTGEAQGATLTSAALTNRPFLDGMPAIAMSDWRKIDRGDADRGREKKRVTKVIMADRVARTVRVVADDGSESTIAVEGLEAVPTVFRLSDVRRTAEGTLDFASVPVQDQALIAGEVFRAMQVQGEMQAAVEKGLITPAQRPFYEKMELSDLTSFRELVKTMKPVVELGERGIAGGEAALDELSKLEAQIDSKVRERMKDGKVQYHEALKLVASEHPELDRRRTQLIRERSSR